MTKARVLADYVAGGTTAAEFDYMDGVTSNVQTQMNAKAPLASPAFTGTPTGITAAHITSGVLPVGVTGGSGLTALGTVTTGNLSNSAIVYPNGHIIQVVTGTSGAYVQSGGSSSHVWGNTGGIPSVTITPTDASNKVFLKLSLNCHSAAHVIYVDFYRSISGGATTHNLSGETTGGLAYHNADHTAQMGISYLDSPATTSAITYKGSFRSHAASQVVYFGDGNGFSTIVAMEVVA